MSHPFEILEDLFSSRVPLAQHAENIPAVARALHATDEAIADFKIQIADAFFIDWKMAQQRALAQPEDHAPEPSQPECEACGGDGCIMCLPLGQPKPELELIEGGGSEPLESPSLALVAPAPVREPEAQGEAPGGAPELTDTLVDPEEWQRVAQRAAVKYCTSRPEWRDECVGAVIEKFSAEYPKDMREAHMMAKHAVIDKLRELGGRRSTGFWKSKATQTVPINHTGHVEDTAFAKGGQGYRAETAKALELADPNSDMDFRDAELRDEIKGAMEKAGLTPNERDVFWMRAADHTHAEIGEFMGFTESRSSQLLGTAREKLVNRGGLTWMARTDELPKWLVDRGHGAENDGETREVPKVVSLENDDESASRLATTKAAPLQQKHTNNLQRRRQPAFSVEMAEDALRSIDLNARDRAIMGARARGLLTAEIADEVGVEPQAVIRSFYKIKKLLYQTH